MNPTKQYKYIMDTDEIDDAYENLITTIINKARQAAHATGKIEDAPRIVNKTLGIMKLRVEEELQELKNTMEKQGCTDFIEELAKS